MKHFTRFHSMILYQCCKAPSKQVYTSMVTPT